MPRSSLILLSLCLFLSSNWLLTKTHGEDNTPSHSQETAGLQPLPENDEDFVELAPYMTELQRFTHKMALATHAGNVELANFYLYESILLLENIQKDVPEYRNQPIALLVDRMGLPAFKKLEKSLNAEPFDVEKTLTDLDLVVNSCNQCHAATDHSFIKITRGTDFNPFNQSFQP